ncbi:acylphosphatase-1-like [Anticarsia gemmatalis]|uniref:acylphosphatase-1-like n=1 Tax=Anticarsia gemmatalis TaxID=129554 RepID=UPI003F76A313
MLRVLAITAVASVLRANHCTVAVAMTAKAVDFEVFGRVQGVFFRKYTKQEADRLGLRGWCKNTAEGTVLGHMQGPSEKVESMMQWLKTKGSPTSTIQKAEFRNQKEITEYTFQDFGIRKD